MDNDPTKNGERAPIPETAAPYSPDGPAALNWCAPLPFGGSVPDTPSDGLLLSTRFSSQVLPEIARAGAQINWCHDALTPFPARPYGISRDTHIWSTHLFSGPAERDPACSTFSISVHLLEDNPRSAHFQRHFRISPGPAIFFDCSLPNLFLSRFSHSTGGTDLNALMDQLFGANSVRVGDIAVRGWNAEVFHALYTWGEAELRAACPTIVTTESQRRFCDRLAIRSEMLTHPFTELPPSEVDEQRTVIRNDLGIALDAPIILISGGTSLLERRLPLLEAWLALVQLPRGAQNGAVQEPTLLWISPSPDVTLEIKRYVARHLHSGGGSGAHSASAGSALGVRNESAVDPRFRIITARSRGEFLALHGVGDIFVSGRADGRFGPDFGTLAAIERGVPLVLTSTGFGMELPRSCACLVEPGYGEERALIGALGHLLTRPNLRSTLSNELRLFAARRSPAAVAAHLMRILDRSRSRSRETEQQNAAVLRAATRALLDEERAHISARAFGGAVGPWSTILAHNTRAVWEDLGLWKDRNALGAQQEVSR